MVYAQEQGTPTQPGQVDSLSGERSWAHVQLYSILGGGMIPDGPYESMDAKARWELYRKETFLIPAAYIWPWITVIPEEVRNYPPKWTGFGGYAKRAGARFVGDVTERSVSHSMHYVMRTEPRYIPCRCDGGFWKRVGHAIAYYYVTKNDDGKTVPNVSRVFGAYSGQLVTHAFYPGDYDEWRAVRRATGSMMWGWWLNLLREFRPEIVGLVK